MRSDASPGLHAAGGAAGAPVIVTGAAGFIGSHVSEAILARGGRVVGVDNLDGFYAESIKRANLGEVERAAGAGGSFRFVQADICDAEAMRRVFEEVRPAAVIHLAARAGVRPSIEAPALYARVNVEGTATLLEAARRAGCGRFVLASSSSVYGDNAKAPFAETDEVAAPISPYAATKRACELMAHAHHALHGMPVACLRFFTAYGPRQRPDLAIAKFMRLIAEDRPIPMFGDGATSRDYTYIDDIVAGVLAAVDRAPEHGFRIWNLGGNEPVSLSAMIRAIGEVAGREPRVERLAAQPGDVERTFADLTRSGAELGYRPKTAFCEGLARQWRWMQESGARTA